MSMYSIMLYDVEKFCGKGNFSLWQRWMKDLLNQQGVHKALLGKEKKPETMKDVEWGCKENEHNLSKKS